jgi:hypothetical protein
MVHADIRPMAYPVATINARDLRSSEIAKYKIQQNDKYLVHFKNPCGGHGISNERMRRTGGRKE